MCGRTIGILGLLALVLSTAGAVRAQQAEEKSDRAADSESAYLERLKEVRLIEIRHLRSGDAKEFEAGRTRILAIEDDAAVGPLVHVLYGPNERYRGLLVEALGRHAAHGSEAARAYLEEIAVGDSSRSHRRRAVQALQANRSAKDPAPTERLLAHLALDEVAVLRDRAAEALAAMDEKRAVWLLAERLVTVEYRLVGAEVADYNMMLDIRGQWAGVPVFRQVAIQAAVAGGGIATTFIDLPQVQIVDFATTIAMTEHHTAPDYQRVEVRHPQILAALKKLTGKDFGYDVKAWQRWLDTQPQDIPPWEPIRFKAEGKAVEPE